MNRKDEKENKTNAIQLWLWAHDESIIKKDFNLCLDHNERCKHSMEELNHDRL